MIHAVSLSTGKVTVKEELKTEDIVSPPNDTVTMTLKKEPPDKSVKEERDKDEKNEVVPEQTLGVDVKTEKREVASGKLKEEKDEDENGDVKRDVKRDVNVDVKTESDAKVPVKSENRNESTKATLSNGSHDKDTVVPPVGDVKQEKGECEFSSEESKDNTKNGQSAEGDKGKEAASEVEERGERCSRKEVERSGVAVTSVTEKEKSQKKVSKNVGDGDHGPCETGGPKCENDGPPQGKGNCEGDRPKDKDSSSSEKHQNVTENGQEKDSSQDKDTPEDKVSVEGQHRAKDVSETQEDDKERHHFKDSLQEKQDSAKEKQKDSIEKKQDTGEGKQDSLTEKQDSVEDKQEDKEASVKEENVNCHDKDKDDAGRGKQKHVDSDVSCVTGDTDTGKIETDINKSLEEKVDACEGGDKEEVVKKEGKKGSVSQRRKRPRRSDKLQLGL